MYSKICRTCHSLLTEWNQMLRHRRPGCDIRQSAGTDASTLGQMDVVTNLALEPLLCVDIHRHRSISALCDAAAATRVAIGEMRTVLNDIEGPPISSNDALTMKSTWLHLLRGSSLADSPNQIRAADQSENSTGRNLCRRQNDSSDGITCRKQRSSEKKDAWKQHTMIRTDL
jgi:hypothetical protein